MRHGGLMRVVVVAALTLLACSPPDRDPSDTVPDASNVETDGGATGPRRMTIRPLIIGSLDGGVVEVDGVPLTTETWTREWPTFEEARAARVRVALVQNGSAVSHAYVEPLEHCRVYFTHATPHDQPPLTDVVHESMEAFLVTPGFDARDAGFIDGPCIQCHLANGQPRGGCGGGVMTELVDE